MDRRFINMVVAEEGLALLSLLLFSVNVADAQAGAAANVLTSIVSGVSITCSGGNDGSGALDFGVAIVNTTASINANMSNSASLFSVRAGAGMMMNTSYSATALLDSLGDALTYTPQVVGAQLSTSQTVATTISSGAQITMSGLGAFFIWVGGTVDVPGTVAGGTYTGDFSLTVSY